MNYSSRRIRISVLIFSLLCASTWAMNYTPTDHSVKTDVPYLDTPPSVVSAMLDLGGLQPTDRICDLGSGDGRIVLAAGEKGASGVGFELDPKLVRQSERSAADRGLSSQVRFEKTDLFEADLSEFNLVFMYLSPRVNRELRPKLLEELKSGSRVVTHIFPIDGWVPEEVVLVEGRRLFLYTVQ